MSQNLPRMHESQCPEISIENDSGGGHGRADDLQLPGTFHGIRRLTWQTSSTTSLAKKTFLREEDVGRNLADWTLPNGVKVKPFDFVTSPLCLP